MRLAARSQFERWRHCVLPSYSEPAAFNRSFRRYRANTPRIQEHLTRRRRRGRSDMAPGSSSIRIQTEGRDARSGAPHDVQRPCPPEKTRSADCATKRFCPPSGRGNFEGAASSQGVARLFFVLRTPSSGQSPARGHCRRVSTSRRSPVSPPRLINSRATRPRNNVVLVYLPERCQRSLLHAVQAARN